MKKKFFIPPETIDAQSRAANPADSVWVSANAGSGKTHVLTERVIRLLLEGTPPSKILCLTYTKAAAAVMQNRVFSRLSEWAILSDMALAEKLKALEGKTPDAQRLATARRLFARALETPGGLKIQTIHAFCEAILHQFPLEANIAGHFEMMDDLMQSALIAEARRQLLEAAYTSSNQELAEAFATVLSAGGEFGLENLLDEAVYQRHGLQEFLGGLGVAEERSAALHRFFDFRGDETDEELISSLWPLPEFDETTLNVILGIPKGANRAQDFALQLQQMDHATSTAQYEAILRAAFLKTDGQPKSGKYIGSAAVRKLLPMFDEDYDNAARFVYEGLQRLKELRLVRLNLAVYTLLDDLIARYQKMKRQRGLLDFEDLITRTVALLARDGAGQWVQYKLDRGIDHILVDEAQDTSPDQWRIIRMLSEEFFSGLGQRDTKRTLFAVGDEKQSIYSFQGAVPEDFAASGYEFQRKAKAAELSFEKIRLNFSFRSAPDVLMAVDEVFSHETAYRGLGLEPEPTVHEAIRAGSPGEVEVWDMLTPMVAEEPDDWRVPIDHLAAPAIRLAEQIAQTIRHWLDNGELIHGQNRKMEPRDIMILVRKRDQFMPALSRALKNLRVPVAGSDRLRLTSHIAIQDLMALGRYVLQASDDLSLAALLKSPIFGWDDDQLFALAHPRPKGLSLSEQLYFASLEEPKLIPVHKKLRRWRDMADTMPVYEFYAHILGAEGARRQFIARLGPEAGDILDEFQNYCLATERTGLPGLQAFLEALDASSPEIKRELDQNRDEVRIMTVHASKGLEASVVFLVDPGNAAWNAKNAPKLIDINFEEPEGFHGKGYLWQPNKAYEVPLLAERIEQLKQRAEEEYRRLLYVGMTRAEDRLIVCGYRGQREESESWHKLVSNALMDKSKAFDHPVQDVVAIRYRKTPIVYNDEINEEIIEKPSFPPLPTDFLTPLVPEAGLPRPLAPSGAAALIEADEAPPLNKQSPILDEADQKPGFALQRGKIIHALLQRLPEIDPSQREMTAKRYLAHRASTWSDQQCEQAWRSVAAILHDPKFSAVFDHGSQAEVSIMGTLQLNKGEQAVSGIIDRICVSESQITIIDYKTNRPPARSLSEVPQAYITQLALYSELLKPLYPKKEIVAALLFTEGPYLIELPEATMNDALNKLGYNTV